MTHEIVRVTSTNGREKFQSVKENSIVSVLAIGEREEETVTSLATLIERFFIGNGHKRQRERREMNTFHPVLLFERYASGKKEGYECIVKIKQMGKETRPVYSKEQRSRRHDHPTHPRTVSWDRYIIAFDVKAVPGDLDKRLSLIARNHFLEYVERQVQRETGQDAQNPATRYV